MYNTLYEIRSLLNRLGVTANYACFIYMSCALTLCVERPESLLQVTKWLYPEVARQCKTTSKSVERGLRLAGDIIWCENRPLLEELARRPLTQKPRNAQLLAILCASFDGRTPCPKADNMLAPTGENNILEA